MRLNFHVIILLLFNMFLLGSVILEGDRDAFDRLLDSQSSFWEEVERRKIFRGSKLLKAKPLKAVVTNTNTKGSFAIGDAPEVIIKIIFFYITKYLEI